MKRKRALQSILFCVVFLIVINGIYPVLSWKDTGGDYHSVFDTFYDLDGDLVDVLFMGSSRCYCAINNSILWNEYGIASFSLSISGQDLASTYYCLVEALKTQTPKVVCIESYGAVLDGYEVIGNLYRNTLPYKLSPNSYEAAQSIVTEGNPLDYWLKWPIVHTRYSELTRKDFETDFPAYLGYSADFHTEPIQNTPLYTGKEAVPTSERNEEYLRRIIALAKEHDISLCFFVAPYAASEKEQKIYNYVKQLAEENQAAFLNMLTLDDELEMDVQTDYINWFHTNYFGAEKISHYMGRYLKEHYSLPDRHGDGRYALWDEDAIVRQHEVQNELVLRKTSDMTDYLTLLPQLDGYTVFLSTDGKYISDNSGTDVLEYLRGLGVNEEYYTGRHIWIWEDGQIIYTSPDTDFLEYGDLPGAEYALISSKIANSVLIDKTSHRKTPDGINVVVYDNVLKEVVDSIGFYSIESYSTIR